MNDTESLSPEKTNNQNEIFWTTGELQEWIKAGLIPLKLFEKDKQTELAAYLKNNKETLRTYAKRDSDDDIYEIKVPSPNEWGETYELQVIDKRTGEIVNILEQMRSFELCDGISLKIKAKELPEWEKETINARKLSKEQNETLKATLEKLGPERPLTRKDIVKIIEEVSKPRRTKKIRHAGHFADSKLQYSYPKDGQLSFFDTLSPATKDKIESSNVEVKAIGVKLTPAEDKLINAIYKLLHDKSENQDEKSDLFYGGNEPGQLILYGGEDQKARSAFLRIKPSELYEEYLGSDTYSGKEISNVKQVLHGICEKKFLIRYDRKRKIKCGNKIENRTDRIEEFQNLIKVVSYIEGMTDTEVDNLNKGELAIQERRGELIIALNPILTDQISSKYIEYPMDINQRTMIASGGHLHVTESINALRDYMLREISNKRYKCEINVGRLPYILRLDNYVKSHRKKLIQERINGAINASKNLGIILNYEIQEGYLGQLKYVFTLNENFE